jgi:hypothetical protein
MLGLVDHLVGLVKYVAVEDLLVIRAKSILQLTGSPLEGAIDPAHQVFELLLLLVELLKVDRLELFVLVEHLGSGRDAA